MPAITNVDQAKAAGAYDSINGVGSYGKLATAPTDTSSNAVLVSSKDSRTNYANNVTSLNTATANLATNNANNATAIIVPKYGDTVTDSQGNKGVAKFDPNTGDPIAKPSNATIPTDTSKENEPDENGMVTTADGTQIHKSVKNLYDTSLASLDQGIADAKNNLQMALQTMNNDPAAQSAINMIMQKYDQQIQAMKDKNRVVLGSVVKNSARNGSLQFANEMDSNFLSEEQDKASKRVTDLITLATQKVMEASAAFKKGDVQAFDAASKALEKATKDKSDALNKLLTASDKAVKSHQADVKIAATAQKQEITDNIRISTALGKTVAETIANSGIKDEKEKRQYIEAMAEKSGITDPDILENAVVKAQQDQSKLDLSAKNTNSIIAKRNAPKTPKPITPKGGGKDGSYSYTGDDVSLYSNLMNQGGKSSNGTVFAPRGQDGYVDPGTYVASYQDWVKNGGTPQGFVKKFPITNVNPDDHSSLPKALQPKTKASSNTPV